MKTKVVTVVVLIITLIISLIIGATGSNEKITPTLTPDTSAPLYSYTYEIVINEIMASNSESFSDGDGDFEDWIELYNPSSGPVDLTGYFLSDDLNDPTKWQFPAFSFIPARGYLVVFASGKDTTDKEGYIHTNFSISRQGESVFVTENDGETIVDLVEPIYIPRDYSYGRNPDASSNWSFFEKDQISPGKTNNMSNESNSVVNPELNPQFSHMGGFFPLSIDLELYSRSDVDIYYTLDGSIPDKNSNIYEGPIRIKKDTIKPEHEVQIISEGVTPKFPISYIKTTPDEAAERIGWVAPKKDINKATVVRAVAYDKSGNISQVITNSYFVGTIYSLPVISIATDINNLFDYERGIYVPGKVYFDNGYGDSYWGTPNGNYFNRGIEWERPAHIEFYDTNSSLGFSLDIGLRIHGSGTRGIAHKSLRLYARKDYDIQDTFNYDIFQGLKNPITNEIQDEFKRLILRNGGQENYSSIIKDMVLQSLMENHMIDTQASRPSVVFINGEYWGIHNIRERFDQHYLSNKYGGDPEDYTMVISTGSLDQGIIGSEQHYKDMVSFVRRNDMSKSSNYEQIKTLMDVENYINYIAFQVLIGNFDWPSNNVNAWRYNTEYNPEASYGHDGRWRWMLFDLDYGFGFKEASYNTINDLVLTSDEGSPKPDWSTHLIRGLLDNEEFRTQLLNCFADQLNTIMDPKNVIEKVDYFERLIAPEIQEHIDRWTIFPQQSVSSWKLEVRKIRNYAYARPDYVKSHLYEYFDVDEMKKITLDVSNSNHGTIKINSLKIGDNTPERYSSFPWSGEYFVGNPVRLEAIAAAGYKFVRWEGINESQEIINVLPEQTNNIKAIFERAN